MMIKFGFVVLARFLFASFWQEKNKREVVVNSKTTWVVIFTAHLLVWFERLPEPHSGVIHLE